MVKDFKGQILIVLFLILSSVNSIAAPDGKALFQSNCASCHNPLKDATGPALKGIDTRVPNKEWIYKWVHNSASLIASGDKYANDIYNKWNKVPMTGFPSLTNEEIDAIVTYVNSVEDKKKEVVVGEPKSSSSDNTLLYVILSLVLLVAVVVLTQVNKVLSRSANVKAGLPSPKDVPFFRNKVVLAITAIAIITALAVWLTNGADFGRQKNYMPKQPIFYSHKVHAGINQINCLYCHSGAEKSRHAMVPSTNVCMNCHKQVNEYTGKEEHPLVDLEGNTVDGSAQIDTLYKYAGWDKTKKSFTKLDEKGNPIMKEIPWTKIHNLPDHVYFNHSLHVVSGKVACQRCHGNVEEMDEVYQHEDLSMGWCVNCHRETKVQFQNNDYYSIFKKYHQEIKEGKRSEGDVKVSEIGGLECQKCHY